MNEGQTRYGEVYTPLDLLFRTTVIPSWTSATTVQVFATLVLDLLANGGEVTEPTLSSSLWPLRTTRLLLPRVVNELCLQGMSNCLIKHFLGSVVTLKQALGFQTLRLPS